MKYLSLFLVLFMTISVTAKPLIIESSQFQAGSEHTSSSISEQHSIRGDTASFQPLELRSSAFGFLGFDVEDEDILETYFISEEPDLLVQESLIVIGDFKVAPSPVTQGRTSYFCYRLGNDQDVSILIYNRRGQLIESRAINSGVSPGGQAGYQKVPIDTASDYSAGLYFAFLKVDGEVKRTKFEIQP